MVQPRLPSLYLPKIILQGTMDGIVTEKDRVNHRRTVWRNRRPGRCRHCCTTRMIEVDGQLSQWRHLLEYPQRRLGVSGISYINVMYGCCWWYSDRCLCGDRCPLVSFERNLNSSTGCFVRDLTTSIKPRLSMFYSFKTCQRPPY